MQELSIDNEVIIVILTRKSIRVTATVKKSIIYDGDSIKKQFIEK